MSDAMTRDLSGAMASARRTAANSVALLKGGLGKAKAEEPIEPAPAANENREASIISVNAAMTGSIDTPDELRVHGAIEGDVRASKVWILAGGRIRGDVTAEVVIVSGAVEGRIFGHDVLLCAGAVVSGEINHCTLGIDTAAVFEGSIKRVERPAAEATAA